jgi:hypothetical protein
MYNIFCDFLDLFPINREHALYKESAGILGMLLGETLKWRLFFFFFFLCNIFFKVKYAIALLGQIMQSVQLDLKNLHYFLCEIQSVFSILML